MLRYCNLNDQELISLLKEGDELAYTEIYNRYKRLLQNHAYKKMGDLEEVKDVLQELFANLWTKRAEIPTIINLSGYLYTALRNRIFNIAAHKQVASKYVESLQTFINEDHCIADHLIREKEFALLIQKEMDALPPRMREVFELSRKSGLSHKEIANQLEISEQTVSKQITNAIKTLKVRLSILFILFFLLF
ncbi:RNA polymerase sigma factor [Pedobacter foliorum]|uniref:RNA polymerase sigma factor n=1 Tax=Pedobacter foliorum TaxID=2739058 RepID=UPI0015641181|nr:RNA polymerase sigma-70 factor [Pedobacter foliorum]NRF41917.1 RNA polymerase sigma-70 factor [Pedobacter foliorum]